MTRLEGPRKTPKEVYDSRWFRIHLTGKNLGRGGVTVIFHGPYGIGMTAAQVLARAVARRQITTYRFGYCTKEEIAENRHLENRFDEVIEQLAETYGFDWVA